MKGEEVVHFYRDFNGVLVMMMPALTRAPLSFFLQYMLKVSKSAGVGRKHVRKVKGSKAILPVALCI